MDHVVTVASPHGSAGLSVPPSCPRGWSSLVALRRCPRILRCPIIVRCPWFCSIGSNTQNGDVRHDFGTSVRSTSTNASFTFDFRIDPDELLPVLGWEFTHSDPNSSAVTPRSPENNLHFDFQTSPSAHGNDSAIQLFPSDQTSLNVHQSAFGHIILTPDGDNPLPLASDPAPLSPPTINPESFAPSPGMQPSGSDSLGPSTSVIPSSSDFPTSTTLEPTDHGVSTAIRSARPQEIAQTPYTRGIKTRHRHSAPGPGEARVSYGDMGFSLQRAHEEDFAGMEGRDRAAVSGERMQQKMTVRITFDGFEPYSRQINVLAAASRGNGRKQPTKARLATLMAREVKAFVNKNPSFPYAWEQLVLLHVDFVSNGSLQPRIGVTVAT
ncbi:hypothetical protein C8Q74DRAFT_1311538 [Fomes fomentarius]|nr:hypothetical protein C8Q74DRAFT_1311538 [Fomes fomentarius]